jgi:hypothetical protein
MNLQLFVSFQGVRTLAMAWPENQNILQRRKAAISDNSEGVSLRGGL